MTELEKLNRFTRREHQAEEVYLFDVVLCDNDVDRDMEHFSDEALGEMKELFIGKTGIFDHKPSTEGQTARIYDTELVSEPGKQTKDGRPYRALRAKAYMIRTGSNADLIREIEGGIKKEVSVSCCVGRKTCSVCGVDKRVSGCTHVPGRNYGEKLCSTVLEKIKDAYEWSFVAVPAQVNAGVTKRFSVDKTEMDSVQKSEILTEVERMIREEVLALCGRKSRVSKALCMAAVKMNLQELMAFKRELLNEESTGAEVQLLGCGLSSDVEQAFRMPEHV